MADQKKWFKVWMSILTDPHFINLTPKQVGRWTRLGALICQQGNDGKLLIKPPSKTYQEWFDVESFSDLIMCIKELPNVQIDPPKYDNGEHTVIMLNWRKYQLDSTGYERLKRSRYKRREREEKEKEKKRGDGELSAFVSFWASKKAEEKKVKSAEIAEGLKAFNLGFRVEDDLYKKIMGEDPKHGAIRSKSISEQAAERKRAQGSQGVRDKPSNEPGFIRQKSAGEIFAGIRNLPTVQPDDAGDPRE